MKFNLTIFFIFIFYFSKSQIIIQACVLDSFTQLPLEYVNIGSPSKGIGTVSSQNGCFMLSFPDSLKNTKIRFSMIGYKTVDLSINLINQNSKIYLARKDEKLKEVLITRPSKPTIKFLGNRTKSSMILGGFASNSLGSEFAVKIKIKHPNTLLKKFTFNIVKNKFEKLKFRFNLYKVGDNGNPSVNMLAENIFIEPNIKTGLVETDLIKYNIYVSEDCFIALEWVKDFGNSKDLFFSTELFSNGTYYKKASQDEWHKISSVGIGLFIEAEY